MKFGRDILWYVPQTRVLSSYVFKVLINPFNTLKISHYHGKKEENCKKEDCREDHSVEASQKSDDQEEDDRGEEEDQGLTVTRKRVCGGGPAAIGMTG